MERMFNTSEFKAAMVRKGYTQKKLANEIGMSEQTFTRRVKRGVFGTDEVSKIISILDISDPTPIFFAASVACKATFKGDEIPKCSDEN